MRRGYPPVWLSALLLTLALLWRMVGAPLNTEQFQEVQTPLWQARVLLPSRMARVLRLWLPGEKQNTPQSIREDGMDADAAAMERLTDGGSGGYISVYMTEESRLTRMTLEDYVCGVVAAEMPAAYHMEALKAQAVAARTRAVKQMQGGGCALHEGADICTDSAHCQGYATPDECKTRWGTEYEVYRDRVVEAAHVTRDELMTYGGQPITVVYHAISGGRTENAQTVFSKSEPYLVSVESQGEEDTRGFQEDLTLTYKEIGERLGEALGGKPISADEVKRTLTIWEYTDTGRVKSMQVNGEVIEGTAFRSALGLRSTWFSLSTDENGVTFHQRGYGHGVGMSQAGANGMAAEGADYAQILTHYYPGVTIEKTE